MERRPYLDKINNNLHIPASEGFTNLNSTTTFPDLKHTGIKSVFEPETVIVATPEGRITTAFKQQSYSTLKDIYRDDIELKNREKIFNISHRQFIDNVLNDMEAKRTQSFQRRSKYWNANKTKLGFTEQFNHAHHGNTSPTEYGTTPLSPVKSAASFAEKKERKQKPVNRFLLFNALLETTEPPKSPQKRFGVISPNQKFE